MQRCIYSARTSTGRLRWTVLRPSRLVQAPRCIPRRTLATDTTQTPNSSIAKEVKRSRAPTKQKLLQALNFIAKQEASSPSGGKNAANRIRNLLIRAQEQHGINLLSRLALQDGRWTDVAAITKTLLSSSSTAQLDQPDTVNELVEKGDPSLSLDDLTDNSIGHTSLVMPTEHLGPQTTQRIQDVLDNGFSRLEASVAQQQHRALGVVWEALGEMTIECVRNPSINNGQVKPEILEILAMFHHHGLISPAVYAFEPTSRPDAIQQPVVLHLLSLRIIGAMTDAEYRAREREEAKNDMMAAWRELRGRAIRATNETLKPEIWIELILWACLHGGWVSAGFETLDKLCREDYANAWSAISWRDSLRHLLPFGDPATADWDALKAQFETMQLRHFEQAEMPVLSTERTISSEVITAYVDAFTSNSDASRSIKGVPIPEVISRFENLQRMLLRSGLTLQNGSWDAIMTRLVDLNVARPLNSADMESLVSMSPAIGQEISNNDLPPFVFDGNAALLGLLHRALQMQTSIGSLSGATSIIQMITNCVDEARRRSILDFFRSQQALEANPDVKDLFTSNFDGIEHPYFNAELPLPLMAKYIDLATENRSFETVKSLLMADALDEPLLPDRVWGTEHIAPVLARYAMATGDMHMLRQLVQRRQEAADYKGPEDVSLGCIMDAIQQTQLASGQWESALQLMKTRQVRSDTVWDINSMATVAASLIHGPFADNAKAWAVMRLMLKELDTADLRRLPASNRTAKIFGLLCVSSLVNSQFLKILQSTTNSRSFHSPSARDLNVILEAVASSQGSGEAMKLVEILSAGDRNSSSIGVLGQKRLPADIIINVLPRVRAFDGSTLELRSRLQPDIATIAVILTKAIEERATYLSEFAVKWSDKAFLARTRRSEDDKIGKLMQWACKLILSRPEDTRIRAADLQQELMNLIRNAGVPDLMDQIPDMASLEQSGRTTATMSTDERMAGAEEEANMA